MALSADISGGRPLRADTERFIHKNADVDYWGGIAVGEHATGHYRAADDAADSFYIGISQKGDTGDGSAEDAVSIGGGLQESITVAGYTSEALGTFKLIYATDDDTFTLTRPADDALPVGIGRKFRSSGVGDVQFFSMMESVLLGLSGRGQEVMHLGVAELQNGTGDHMNAIPLYGHGKIVDFFGIPDAQGAGAGGDLDFNLELGTTNLTGGVLSVLLAGAQATAKLSASAITAGNEFSDGDELSVEGTENTAFTAGRINLYIVIERMV